MMRREGQASMTNQAGTIRLAVIDTDSGFLTVLGKRLEGAGWEHRVLSSSVPADELVAMKLNALLVDITVLGPEGWDYLEKVCGSVPGLGVLVCTNQSTVAQRVRGLRMGADDWIGKPCHPEEVMARIEAVVRRRKRAVSQRRRRPDGRRRARGAGRPVPGLRQRPEHRPHPPRVRAAAAAGRGARPGDRARGHLPEGLGLRDGPRRPLRGRVRPQAAPEAPAPFRQLALHPHALRDRLPLRSRADRPARLAEPLPVPEADELAEFAAEPLVEAPTASAE